MQYGRRRRVLSVGLAVALSAAFAASVGVGGAGAQGPHDRGFHQHHGAHGEADVTVCSDAVAVGQAHCLAHVRTDADATQATPARPGSVDAAPDAQASATIGNNGAYDPSYLQSAYNAPSSTAGAGQTVAIVDAYDDPNAAADLSYYRSFFGLPACTTANGCFRKVDQSGGTHYPAGNVGWSQEIALDLDMVSAMCPRCNILLVEAKSAYMSDLGTAVNTAVNLGAAVVSNSYGSNEYGSESADSAAYFNHPGVAIVASSGDSGYGVEFPAASGVVTAVGGTSLVQSTNTGTRNATETAWSGAGSGCSAFVAKPAWQHDAGCSTRTVADVSAVADPSTGVWVYDTYGTSGFLIFGGTSVASPIIGSMYALAGNAASSNTPASYPYAQLAAVNDVTSGSNGTCAPAYLCTAGTGYDGPTGLGTPNSTPAFTAAPVVPTPPSAPQGLAAAAGNAKITLTWTPPSTTGGSTVTYSVYRGTSPGGEAAGALATGQTGTSFVDTGVSNGTTYYYVVRSTNGLGTGPASNEAFSTPAGVPGAPTFTAAPSSTKGVTLAWNAPASNGSAIVRYSLYRGSFPGFEGSLVSVVCSASSCSYNDSSARSGRTYYYQAAAVNAIGTGPRSAEASARAR